jgi:signal peptide peptidase SppA
MSLTARVWMAAAREVWAMERSHLERVAAVLQAHARGVATPGLTAEDLARVEARAARSDGYRAESRGDVAVIPVYGAITHRANILSEFSGGTSCEQLTKAVRRAAADPDVASIVLDVDSPGGTVSGLLEAADAVYEARQQKPIVAVANAMAASAAYWLATQASELVVTPSGTVGSVGVYVMHVDQSAYLAKEGVAVTFIHAGEHKVEGNSYEPLGDEARAEWQRLVDARYQEFVGAVARGRGVSRERVESDYGQGRMLLAGDAARVGMVDRVATLEQVIDELAAGATPKKPSRSARAEHEHRERALRFAAL